MRYALLTIVLTLAISNLGCVALLAGGAAGAAGYAYAKGSETRVYPVRVDVVDQGVQNTLASLQVTVLKHHSDITGSRTEAKTAHGKKFTVETRAAGSATEVKVRVGTFGDDQWSQLIFTQLDKQTSLIPTQPTPAVIPVTAEVEKTSNPAPARTTNSQ